MNVQNIMTKIRHLKLDEGDFVHVRLNSEDPKLTITDIQMLEQQLSPYAEKHGVFFFLSDESVVDIRKIPEKALNKCGWYKKI